ncbi:MAG: hybrid sensor histidine kinase/response regulator [Anaerolineae bacterium]|nr:hybrid sensor histidine kinase/response regulator [Anaerolineae bacterium]
MQQLPPIMTENLYDDLDFAEKPQTVLVVEDERDLRKGIELMLKLEKFVVVTAGDGREALEMLESGRCRPDIIVSDIKMPRMDGYGLLDAVRLMPDIGPIPFIFLTAFGSSEFMNAAHERGVDEYLVKPFDPHRLVVVVRNKLRRAEVFRRYAEEQLNRARQHIIEVLSHELRTPLTTVLGAFDILEAAVAPANEEEPIHVEEVQFSMNIMRVGIRRLNRMMEQTLRYADILNGHLRLQFHNVGHPFDVRTLLDKTIQMAQLDFETKQVTLDVQIDLPHGLRVVAVPAPLVAGLYEVLRNAANFSQVGQTVCLTAEHVGNNICIVIRDEGRGIQDKDEHSVFQPMVQSNRIKQEQQGLGLGLAIAKGTIQIHRGDIQLETAWGKGTQVTIHLPVADQH